MKTAFIFPGQGAQYVGMGKDFYEQVTISKEMFDRASEICGMDLPALCFEENEQLNITEYTQIAMLVTEVAILKALEERGVKKDVCAGLSLGEYGALTAAHVMDYEDVCRVVRQRGIFMQEAVPSGGAMAAVLGCEETIIENICSETEGIVEIANYNCPGQIVISGEQQAVDLAAERLKEAGAKRVLPLKVSGPFHSSMLKGAGERLGGVLKDVKIHDIKVPYAANVTAEYVKDASQVKTLLEQQVSSSVRWEQTIRMMLNDGVDTFIEIGPGKTLTGFMKKIDRSVRAWNVEKLEDVDKVIANLEGE